MKSGFTLIELVVALAIIAALLAMTVQSTRGDQREALVRGAAEEFAATCRTVRQQALTTRQPFAIVFNIQNAPGSSGAVLNNRSGGHWYRVLGPSRRTRLINDMPNQVPWPGGKLVVNHSNDRMTSSCTGWAIGNFPDYVADIHTSWIGAERVLPAGKVRFLALGDADEGPRQWRRNSHTIQYYGFNGETTYPRPWFGYFDKATGRWWAWGGYDPAKNYSGFYYEGSEGDIPDSRHPTTRTVDHDWDANTTSIVTVAGKLSPQYLNSVTIANTERNGDAAGDPGYQADYPYEIEDEWPMQRAGEPRALVDGRWADARLVFNPDGSVIYGEWNEARRLYGGAAPVPPCRADQFWSLMSGPTSNALWKSGPGDRSFRVDTASYSTSSPRSMRPWGAEVAHYDHHTGGWHITFAPDVPEDRTTFASASEVLDALLPAYRVHVGTLGTVRVFRVSRQSGYLATLPAVWPPNPSDWNGTALINSRYRRGYLHANNNLNILAGTPITDIVDPEMLTRRVWWRP